MDLLIDRPQLTKAVGLTHTCWEVVATMMMSYAHPIHMILQPAYCSTNYLIRLTFQSPNLASASQLL